ncbi:aminoacyl-tRNA hydrolase [Entomospira entomophila]|uniref:aminoacyl-tRNA hydrolase n=1 Tax=Entomospira entomophila TaxID=2719988 RepID=UPI0024809E05|nr:aminoacyl-tRNA hydrolase [Entomospira entomophilus]
MLLALMLLNKTSQYKIIIGLGNPGLQYQQTRHNVGFQALDTILSGEESYQTLQKDMYYLYKLPAPYFLYLLKPQTFMNLSGKILPAIWKKTGTSVKSMLVICDNLDLPIGHLKFKEKGSSAGQKGLQSIIEHAGTQDFHRIFIGIGRPDSRQDVANYVLSKFNASEQMIMQQSYQVIQESIPYWLQGKFLSIHESFNTYSKSLS